MTQSPDLPISRSANPYVGPRTFAYEQRHLFFGREREARDLLARVLSERLLLFYAQSGAGKSSLLRTRLIPQLQEEKGFVVLPVGRVSGELPAGVGQVDNIFVFNLLLSIDEGGDPARLARVTLADFLARLTRQAVADPEGGERKGWVYDAEAVTAPAAPNSRRYALVVDQFEEIVTSHPGRWREREEFFRQIDGAMRADPSLWVVLTLREDYVAALDPYAPFIADRLRARFYMERMDVAAALEAIRQPAAVAGRPFAEGVAEQLADELRQVRVPGQEATVAGQYVEPVQLQVVCYQLWEGLGGSDEGRKTEDEGRTITFADLARAGDVDRALTLFYEETLAAALADPDAASVSERQLRGWFDKELITEAGTRGLVRLGETETGSLPSGVVAALQRRFLVRGEARGGDTWIELVHDRFVQPIRQANRAWLGRNLNPLSVDAQAWLDAGKVESNLYDGSQLATAAAQMRANPAEFGETERAFVEAGQQVEMRRAARRQRVIAWGAVGLAVVFIALAGWALWSRLQTVKANEKAQMVARRARANELAAYAAGELSKAGYDGSLAAVLAMAAVKTTWPSDGYVTASADSALQDVIAAVTGIDPRMTLPRSTFTGQVESVSFSPHGKFVVTAGCDVFAEFGDCRAGSARIWDATTGLEVRQLSGHAGKVNTARYSSDGKLIVTASEDGSSRVWEVATGKNISQFRQFDRGRYSAFSPDGRFVISSDQSEGLYIWDASTGNLVRQLSAPSPFGFPFHMAIYSPNGGEIAESGFAGALNIWNAATGELIHELVPQNSDHRCSGYNCAIVSLAYSLDGRYIVTAEESGISRVLDAATGKEVSFISNDDCSSSDCRQFESASFSPDGKFIVTVSRGMAYIWDVATGRVVRTIRGVMQEGGLTAFSPDGKFIVTMGCNAFNNRGECAESVVDLWDASTGQQVRRFGGRFRDSRFYNREDDPSSAIYSPDGKQILGVAGSSMSLWDAVTGQEIRQIADIQGTLISATYSPDGRLLATVSDGDRVLTWMNDRSARVLSVTTGEVVITLGVAGCAAGEQSCSVNSAAFSPDGKSIITAGEDGAARIWDAATGQEVRRLQVSGCSSEGLFPDGLGVCGVKSTIYSPDGRYIATVAGFMRRRNLKDVLTGSRPGSDRDLRIWDAATGEEIRVLSDDLYGVRSVAFSPDSQQILVVEEESFSSVTSILDATTGQEVIQLDRYCGTVRESGGSGLESWTSETTGCFPIRSANFSPDGEYIITTDASSGARILDAATGKEVRRLVHAVPVESAAYSPDGRYIVTTSGDGMAHIWVAHIDDLLSQAKLLADRFTTSDEIHRFELKCEEYSADDCERLQ